MPPRVLAKSGEGRREGGGFALSSPVNSLPGEGGRGREGGALAFPHP